MAFILRWVNPNKLDTTVNIYRDTKALVSSALPAPSATLSNGETEWTDPDATPGATYYYMLSVTNNGKTVFSAQQQFTVSVKRGIGPSDFIWGNDDLGYLGTVPYAEQIKVAQLPPDMQELINGAITDRCPMLKFSYRGRIIYVIDQSGGILANTSWAKLYNAGLVYGTGDTGPKGAEGALAPTVQDAAVVHKNDKYIIRCPRGVTEYGSNAMVAFDSKNNRKPFSSITPLLPWNEYQDIVLGQFMGFPDRRRCPATRVNPITSIGNNQVNTADSMYGAGVLCQERDSASENVLLRGLYYTDLATSPVAAADMLNYASQSQTGMYFPIFELVE